MTIWVIKQKLYKFIQKVIKKFNLYLNFTVEWVPKVFSQQKKIGGSPAQDQESFDTLQQCH